MNNAKLEDWAIVGIIRDPHQPPEQRSGHLFGRVYGHPNHEDGKSVITSVIMHADGREVITLNTKYHLGKAHKAFKKWYYDKYRKTLDEESPFADND